MSIFGRFHTLTADEIALYDRQIRLWGMATQLRLRLAKILLIHLGSVGTEVVKNLVLGGLNLIEILDHSEVKEEDFAAQFFLPNDASLVGLPKLPQVLAPIKELNSRVNLSINTRLVDSYLQNEPHYFKQFDLIIATELSKKQILDLNAVARDLKIPLYVAGQHGMFGYIFADLLRHEAVAELDAGNQPRKPHTPLSRGKTITSVISKNGDKKEVVTIVDEYVPLEQIFASQQLPRQLNKRQLKRLSAALPLTFALFDFERPADPETEINADRLRKALEAVCSALDVPRTVISDDYVCQFSRQAYAEFSPVAAILGGTLAQDVIQFLSKRESPINNCLIMDAVRSEMPIYAL